MTYATEIVQNYRLALQTLWNSHYWKSEGFRDWDTVRDFEQVQPLLFKGLVAQRLEPLGTWSGKVFGSAFRVVPSLESGFLSTLSVERKGTPPGIWDQVSGPFRQKQVKLTLIDIFDWQTRHYRDFRYYLVKIRAFEDRPELVDCRALVDVLEADVLWNVDEL